MSFDESDLRRRMNGAINSLKEEFIGLRTGRASTALLDTLKVDAYGSKMPINQVASLSTPESRLILIQEFNQRFQFLLFVRPTLGEGLKGT